MKRRNFVHVSLAATGLAAIAQSRIEAAPPQKAAPGYVLKILATNWGFKDTMGELCASVKKEGYDGLELWWTDDSATQRAMWDALKKHDLSVGYLCGGSQADFATHLATFKKAVDAASAPGEIKPLYINCHSSRDFFTPTQNQAFIDHTIQASERSGVPIYHETHRSRMLFAAPLARTYIEQNPKLRLTLDISHWCNVSESLLQDQPENVALALSRTDHIHARVGHAEGPQVSDPRAPEWKQAVDAHLAWWDAVVAEKKRTGKPLTILTEFGPPGYLPTLPFTNQPVADQWAINVYMMQMLRARYA